MTPYPYLFKTFQNSRKDCVTYVCRLSARTVILYTRIDLNILYVYRNTIAIENEVCRIYCSFTERIKSVILPSMVKNHLKFRFTHVRPFLI